MFKTLATVLAVALFALFGSAGSAVAAKGGNACPPQSQNPSNDNPPNCGTGGGGISDDPSCHDGIDNDGDGKTDAADSECRPGGDGVEGDNEEEPPAGETCPPATGPISSVVQQISDGIRDGGGAPLADVIDQINCGVIVGVLGL
jgi:hypothetical protein